MIEKHWNRTELMTSELTQQELKIHAQLALENQKMQSIEESNAATRSSGRRFKVNEKGQMERIR